MRSGTGAGSRVASRDGTFGAAAARLGITQPAVSIQVRELEQGYGLVLFERRGGDVALSAAGTGLFELTSQMFQAEARRALGLEPEGR